MTVSVLRPEERNNRQKIQSLLKRLAELNVPVTPLIRERLMLQCQNISKRTYLPDSRHHWCPWRLRTSCAQTHVKSNWNPNAAAGANSASLQTSSWRRIQGHSEIGQQQVSSGKTADLRDYRKNTNFYTFTLIYVLITEGTSKDLWKEVLFDSVWSENVPLKYSHFMLFIWVTPGVQRPWDLSWSHHVHIYDHSTTVW